jgi:hypothetical protein
MIRVPVYTLDEINKKTTKKTYVIMLITITPQLILIHTQQLWTIYLLSSWKLYRR